MNSHSCMGGKLGKRSALACPAGGHIGSLTRSTFDGLRMRALLAALLLASLLSGCAADDGDTPLGTDTFHMELSGMPTRPMAPGESFNVTVRAEHGMGMRGMHSSDHIGAHMWNMSVADPTAALGQAMTCQHVADEMPGDWQARCTAPMEPGTYHVRAHARMPGEGDQMHHWWSDEQTFTVA